MSAHNELPKGKSRRDLIKIGGTIAVASLSGATSTGAAALYGLRSDRGITGEESLPDHNNNVVPPVDSIDGHESGDDLEHGPDIHPENPAADIVDDLTAAAVVANFGAFVGLSAAGKMDLGSASIAGVASAEIVRILALRHVAPERAQHEIDALRGSLVLIPALVMAVDAGSYAEAAVTALLGEDLPKYKLSPEEIRALQETTIGNTTLEALETMNPDELRQYNETVRREVLILVAKNAGLASILSSLSATLATSAATEAFEPIAKAMTRFSYSKDKLAHPTAKENDAATRAAKSINGNMGLANLVVATAANTNGFIFGDPPSIHSALTEKPATHLRLSKDAFQASLMLNISMYSIWLVREGILDPREPATFMRDLGSFVVNFLSSQLQACTQLYQDVTDRERRDIMLNGGYGASRSYAAKMEALGKIDPTSRQILDLQRDLHGLPQPLIEFPLGDYMRSKMDALTDVIRRLQSNKDNVVREVAASLGAVDSSEQTSQRQLATRLIGLMQNGEVSEQNLAAAMRQDGKAKSEEDVLAYLLDVMQAQPSEIEALTSRAHEVLGAVTNTRINESELTGAISAELNELRLDEEDSDDVSAHISLLTELSRKLGLKEVVRILDNTFRLYRGSEPALEHKPFLSHPAMDALKALATQLPALDSLVRLMSRNVPRLAKRLPQSGARTAISEAKAQYKLNALAVEIISAIGDNVLAKLFGNRTLNDIVSPLLEDAPDDLKEDAVYTSKLIAYILSKVAGSLTKVGCVNNFVVTHVDVSVDDNHRIRVGRTPITMQQSIQNPWAAIQVGAASAYFNNRINRLFDRIEAATDSSEVS